MQQPRAASTVVDDGLQVSSDAPIARDLSNDQVEQSSESRHTKPKFEIHSIIDIDSFLETQTYFLFLDEYESLSKVGN